MMKPLVKQISDLDDKLLLQEEVQSQILLQQAEIKQRQDEQDAVLAQLLLQSQTANMNV